MNSSKDFEITADGELIAYHGKGGCVAIPEGVIFVARDGVFDPKLKITKLKLPSTLLGHKYEDGCEDAYVAHQPRDDDDDYLYIEKYGSMLFFVGSIKSHLSNLKLFKPQGLSIISSKAPRGIHNFQEEVLRVWYAITSSSNCFNQLNCTLTFS